MIQIIKNIKLIIFILLLIYSFSEAADIGISARYPFYLKTSKFKFVWLDQYSQVAEIREPPLNGTTFGGSLELYFINQFNLEFGFDYWKTSMEETYSGLLSLFGYNYDYDNTLKIDVQSGSLSMILKYLFIDGPFCPYIGGGVNLNIINQTTREDLIVYNFYSIGDDYSIDADTVTHSERDFGLTGLAGFKIFFSDKFHLIAEMRYLHIFLKSKTLVDEIKSPEKLTLLSLYGGIGIKFNIANDNKRIVPGRKTAQKNPIKPKTQDNIKVQKSQEDQKMSTKESLPKSVWLKEDQFYSQKGLLFDDFENETGILKFITKNGEFEIVQEGENSFGKWSFPNIKLNKELKTCIRLPDLTKFNKIMISIKSENIKIVKIVLEEKHNQGIREWTVPISRIKSNWRNLEIPFRYFNLSDDHVAKLDIVQISIVKFVIEEEKSGWIGIDNIKFIK